MFIAIILSKYFIFTYFCESYWRTMRELLIRTLSGAVLAILVIGSILLHPLAYAVFLLFVVVVGTFEMGRLNAMVEKCNLCFVETLAVVSFALSSLVAVGVLPLKILSLNLLIIVLPFLLALFSKQFKFSQIATFAYGSLAFLSLPCSLMVFMYDKSLFGNLAGPALVLFVYALMWANDTFAYLTGSLLGKNKLFPRISPGKTIEGSLGGLLMTAIGFLIYNHYSQSMSLPAALGLVLVAVVFGTLGDLCESMLKRQAGVKDSGKLIPGHGGILDRFDSVMFSVPFVFTYLLLLCES